MLGLLLLRLGAGAPATQPDVTRPSPAAVAACAAQGGRLEPGGLSGYRFGGFCAHPYPDAGRRCTDESDCLSRRCRGDDAPVAPDARVAGACAATDYPYGCQVLIRHGRVASDVCVD